MGYSSFPSSFPSAPPQIKYDVFLSFRGEDTRNNFTSHLHRALRDKQIYTFIDDDKLNRGDEISPSLLQAIEESQISVVIFSENYADSRWCLEELVKIVECKKNYGQVVIPIFYGIDPSNVRNQTGSLEIAFSKHEERYSKNLDMVQKWRCVLKEAANLSGFDSRVVKPESVLVEKIVEDVLKRLNNMPPCDNKLLVGIESRITDIELLLGIRDQVDTEFCSVGIWGMGGIGKTTLAKAVFDKIYHYFQGYRFVGNVREASERKELNRLRQELHSAILGDADAYIHSFAKKRLQRMKLLIVFDDVTSSRQIEDLIGDLDCLGSGSRIIITSRDQQVLKNCGVAMDYTYKVEELCFGDALKLFCQHAFKQNYPKVEYKELSKGVVQKVGGFPLALKVLGSFLFEKRKEVWESSIKKLENILDKDIHEVLKISYDGLDFDQQRIFLDIACFYKGWNVNIVMSVMDASDFFIENGLSALMDKCLVFISGNKLMMHDLLEAMGKTIVQQESIDDPGKRSRLWHHNEIDNVLSNAKGTEKIEGISLDMSTIKNIQVHPCAFVKMQKLRFLQFYVPDYWKNQNKNKVLVMQGLESIFSELRYFYWYGCPLTSLQSIFHSKNLVILEMPNSSARELWTGVQQLDNLKSINLTGSRNLISFPDLLAPNLESLNLTECTSLIKIPSCFQHLAQLVFLSLSKCRKVMSIPELPKSLKYLYLFGCSKVQRLPRLPDNLETLYISKCSSLIEIQSSIQHLTRLTCMDVAHCSSLTRIPDCTCLISLRELYLSNCKEHKKLLEIPDRSEESRFSGCTIT